MHEFICLFICSFHLLVCYVCLFVHLFVLFVRSFVRLFVCLFVCLFVWFLHVFTILFIASRSAIGRISTSKAGLGSDSRPLHILLHLDSPGGCLGLRIWGPLVSIETGLQEGTLRKDRHPRGELSWV